MYEDVVLNEYGYYTLSNIPTPDELNDYYSNEYYQKAGDNQGKGSYNQSYSEDELKFIKAKLTQKKMVVEDYLDLNNEKLSFIDIGCGEGFAVKYFYDNGYNVTGLDYSIFGVEKNNPEIKDYIINGDVTSSLHNLAKNKEKYDVINMDNILEHVLEPKQILKYCHNLLSDEGVLVIKVPNDFSYLQQYFMEHQMISKPYWVAIPDHISYFNKSGLIALCEDAGFKNMKIMGNYMTEFSVLNPNTNYMEYPELGKSCHLARVAQENIFNDISPRKTIELYTVLGEMGIGREIIGIFKKCK